MLPLEEMVELTHAMLTAGATIGRGGWSYAQLSVLGVATPLKKGWRRKLEGSFVPANDYARFLAMKNTRGKKRTPVTGFFADGAVRSIPDPRRANAVAVSRCFACDQPARKPGSSYCEVHWQVLRKHLKPKEAV